MLPRIYSLSTVGVIQHYNEDYLIHQTRTDFTGGNGVGKSIIADLLQLIFIHDKKLIKFGTKGFKKNDRQPYTLPYKTDEAYAFLNIEIIENFFICIGVCIPNKDNKRIKPFVIVSDEDINKKIEDLVYPEEKLLKSQHFIEGNAFLSIEQLSRHLRDNHGLTLISFTNREHKEKYYSFLFKRGILPINLSIEENLKTYAKIIQSFSKVDALNVDSSDSLKGFLFEDSKEDYRKEFDAYKRDLENLLTDYERTNKNINNLLQKQKKLNALKDKEIKKSTTHQAYLKADVLYHYSIKENKKTAFSKVERSIEDNRLQKVEYTNYKNEFNSKYENSVQKIRTLKNSLENIQKYKLVYDKLKEMEEKKCSLTQVEVPKISEKIEKTINIDDFDHKEIIRRIKKFKLIYNDYDSLKELENKTLEQLEKLDDHKNELKSKIKRFKEILQIIDLNKKGTLFSKLLNRGLPLTEATETILFHFINMAWGKPNEVTSGIKYTEDINVLEKEHIIKDNESGGYWLKMGGIYEFIPFNKEQQRLFNDQDNIRQAIMEQQKNIQESIGIYEEQLSEIESFKRGDNSLASNVTIQNYDLDGRMYSYAIIKELYETADIIQNLDIKIDYYNTEIASCEKQLVEFKKNIVGEFENEKLDVLEKSLNAKLAVQEQNRDEYLRSGARENTKIEKLIEEMPHRNNEKKEKEAELNQAKLYYIEKLTSFERDCPNIKVDLNNPPKIDKRELDRLKSLFDDARTDYYSEFKTIVNHFPDTQENTEIEVEINRGVYNFNLLESILLGEIKHTDKIGEALTEANDKRIKIAENIHSIMLSIFKLTKDKYKDYENAIRRLNIFFKDERRRINDKYYLLINFDKVQDFDISWIDQIQSNAGLISREGELPLGQNVETFVEELFTKLTNAKNKIKFSDLLDPKTYFTLSVKLTDENGNETGSTGQAYAAIILLGIARLSEIEQEDRKGIRFIILEEMASLDKTNFKTFPNIAEEFSYQIITMTPEPYRSSATEGWYLYHLLKGKVDDKINYTPPSSFFRTNDGQKKLKLHLQRK